MKKISISQLAKICNVSPGTVDRALHGREGINEETKKRILSVASSYGYSLNKKKIKLIGIIVFDLYNEYFSEMIVKFENQLRKYGYYSIVMFSDKNKECEIECIEAMLDAEVSGLIICPVNSGKEFSEYLKSWNIPVVTFGNRVEGIKYVDVNHSEAMYNLTKRIIDKDYKKIVYFSPPIKQQNTNIYGQQKRFEGFIKAVNESNINFEVITEEDNLDSLVFRPKTAVITSTDYYAIKLMLSGKSDKYTIVGFDNVETITKFNLPIMTVSVDRNAIVEKSVEYIMSGDNTDDYLVGYDIIGDE